MSPEASADITNEVARSLSKVVRVGSAPSTTGTAAPVKATVVGRSHILPAGQIPHTSSELLGSQWASDMIDSLTEMFDGVLIDAPPLVPVSDAAIRSMRNAHNYGDLDKDADRGSDKKISRGSQNSPRAGEEPNKDVPREPETAPPRMSRVKRGPLSRRGAVVSD